MGALQQIVNEYSGKSDLERQGQGVATQKDVF